MSTSYALRPSLVLADLVPARPLGGAAVRDAALVLLSSAFIGLSAQVALPVPGSPVPITGQTLAVLLVGAALGAGRGFAATGAYVLLGVAGVPWFADGASGMVTATFGYLVGMALAAALVGGLARRGHDRTPWRVVPTMVLGNVVVYAVGAGWLAFASDAVTARTAWDLGVQPFLLGDALKIALAAGLLPSAWAWVTPRP